MAAYQNKHRYVVHRGREFHFVSYEGIRADTHKDRAAVPPTWFLLSAGKRWAVMPEDGAAEETEVDRLLAAWLERNVFDA